MISDFTRSSAYIFFMRAIRPPKLGAPLVERSIADVVFAAQIGDGGFRLIQDADDLAVDKT